MWSVLEKIFYSEAKSQLVSWWIFSAVSLAFVEPLVTNQYKAHDAFCLSLVASAETGHGRTFGNGLRYEGEA